MLSYIIDRLANPLSAPYRNRDDLVPFGHYLFYLNKVDQAIEVLLKALKNKSLSDESTLLGLITLASIYKKNSDFVSAVPL